MSTTVHGKFGRRKIGKFGKSRTIRHKFSSPIFTDTPKMHLA